MSAYLVAMHCKPLEGHGAMSLAEVERHLRDLPGWRLADGAIEKAYRFDDYHRTFGGEVLHQRVGDLAGHALLDLRPAGEGIDGAGKL